MYNEESKITVVDDQGNEVLCEVLFTFHSEEFNKSYVLYYPIDSEEDDNGNIDIMVSSFVEGEEGGDLFPVESDEEWDMVEEMLNTFMEEEDMN